MNQSTEDKAKKLVERLLSEDGSNGMVCFYAETPKQRRINSSRTDDSDGDGIELAIDVTKFCISVGEFDRITRKYAGQLRGMRPKIGSLYIPDDVCSGCDMQELPKQYVDELVDASSPVGVGSAECEYANGWVAEPDNMLASVFGYPYE